MQILQAKLGSLILCVKTLGRVLARGSMARVYLNLSFLKIYLEFYLIN